MNLGWPLRLIKTVRVQKPEIEGLDYGEFKAPRIAVDTMANRPLKQPRFVNPPSEPQNFAMHSSSLAHLHSTALALSLAILLLTLIGCDTRQAKGPSKPKDRDSTPVRQNNSWHKQPPPGSETTIIFVHGIFSSSETCWANTTTKNYWPSLLAEDPTFRDCGIFIAGYNTEFGSGAFSMEDAVDQLAANFADQQNQGSASPLEATNIVFVGHSTGGILIRDFLLRNYGKLQKKKVGVILLSSPSLGSKYADWLKFVATAYGNKMASQLSKSNPNLANLDDRFRELTGKLSEERGFCLHGIEYLETHFISKPCEQLLRFVQVVTKDDVGQYFGKVRTIPDTDHFTIAAPANRSAEVYKYVRSWYTEFFKQIDCDTSTKTAEDDGPPTTDDLDRIEIPACTIPLLTDEDRKKSGYVESVNQIVNLTDWNVTVAYRYLPKGGSRQDGFATVICKDVYKKLKTHDVLNNFGGPVFICVKHNGRWHPVKWCDFGIMPNRKIYLSHDSRTNSFGVSVEAGG